MKHTYLFIALLCIELISFGQIPDGYYNNADGKTGYALKTALYNIIKNHTVVSYGDLYDVYKTSDTKADNQVWDMYTDIPNGTPVYVYYHNQKNCGNYSNEGDCYNREHCFPQSWFGKESPMKSDAFHVVPSDGYVNGKRSNYPYGEVANVDWTSSNGSKVGKSTGDYTGTVFEPIDEYKGDFARTFFYMATRYEDKIDGWKGNSNAGEVLDGSSDQVYKQWVIDLLLKWHYADPVSTKETVRNDAIYKWQNNRNPFIDKPEFVAAIWDDNTSAMQKSKDPLPTCVYLKNSNSLSFKEMNKNEPIQLHVFNLAGSLVYSAKTTHLQVPLPKLTKGLYLVKISSGATVFSSKFIVR